MRFRLQKYRARLPLWRQILAFVAPCTMFSLLKILQSHEQDKISNLALPYSRLIKWRDQVRRLGSKRDMLNDCSSIGVRIRIRRSMYNRESFNSLMNESVSDGWFVTIYCLSPLRARVTFLSGLARQCMLLFQFNCRFLPGLVCQDMLLLADFTTGLVCQCILFLY